MESDKKVRRWAFAAYLTRPGGRGHLALGLVEDRGAEDAVLGARAVLAHACPAGDGWRVEDLKVKDVSGATVAFEQAAFLETRCGAMAPGAGGA